MNARGMIVLAALATAPTLAQAAPSNRTRMNAITETGFLVARDANGAVIMSRHAPPDAVATQICQRSGYRAARLGEHLLPRTRTVEQRIVRSQLAQVGNPEASIPVPIFPQNHLRNACEHGSSGVAMAVTTTGRCDKVKFAFGPGQVTTTAPSRLAAYNVSCRDFDAHNSVRRLITYFSDAVDDHRQVATLAQRQAAAADGYRHVAHEARILEEADQGTRMLFLAHSPARNDYLLLATGATFAEVSAKGYQLISIEGHIFEAQIDGTVPLQLFYHPARDEYALAASDTLRNGLVGGGYQFIRTEGFVFP